MPLIRNLGLLTTQLGILLLAAQSLFAQLPAPRLTSIFPPGGKSGTTVEITISGHDLDDATQLYFSQSSIAAKPKQNTNGQPELNKFLVTIPANLSPEVCDAHVVGRFGVSNPRAFTIGDASEILAPTTNTTSASAWELPLGSVISGRVAANTQSWFKFAAKKGQRLLVDCQSREIDSRMEDVLVLYDENGRELEHSRRGGLLDFTAPAEGEYRLKIHDFTFRGGDDFFYRLTVGTGPYIDFIYPPAGLPGTKGSYTVYGRNLPGGTPVKDLTMEGKPLEQLKVEIEFPADPLAKQRLVTSAMVRPADAALDGFEYRIKSPRGSSNPFRLGFATAPVITGSLADDAALKPQKISVPCEFTSLFPARGQVASVVFDAKKGDAYWLEVFSQRLGYPTDPFVLVERVNRNDQGEESYSVVQELYDSDTNLGGPDFNTATRDPSYRFEAKEDGQYRVRVRDLFNRNQGGPRYLFRLALHKSMPDFRLVALAVQPPKLAADSRTAFPSVPNLRRKETQVIKVLAFRRDGFDGEIQLHAEGLPADVSVLDAKIEPGKTTALIAFTAKEDAVAWGGRIKITGKAKVDDTELVREARGASVLWQVADFNNEAILSRMARDLAVGVCATDKAAMTIEPATNKVFEAVAGGKLQIPIRVNRHSEFLEALKLKVVGLAALDTLAELDVNNQTNTANLDIDLAKFKLPPGKHTFFVQTQAKGKYRSYAADAQAADGESARAENEVTAANKAAKKAADVLEAAKKAAAEVAAQNKSVTETDKEALAARVKTATEAVATAEKVVADTAAKVKTAEAKKTAVLARTKEIKAKATPKDATIMVYSAPITILVKTEEKK